MVRWANRKDESYMKIVILDGYTENPGDLSWEGFEALGDLTVYDRTTDHSQIAVRIGDAEIILTNKTPVSREIMGACPKLKYIGLLATGYNVVDVKAAKEAGITVTNIPTYGTDAVSQYAIALLLELCHHIGEHSDCVKRGDWTKNKDLFLEPSINRTGRQDHGYYRIRTHRAGDGPHSPGYGDEGIGV